MPHTSSDPATQFATVEDLLTHWLRERRDLLGRYTEIVVSLEGNPDSRQLGARQSALCELMVDYVSAGHFEVFHELLGEAEAFADGSGSLAEKIMPAIGDTTEIILAYEEKYGDDTDCRDRLKRDLSSLGETLESRFALEDQLIAGLHHRHRRQLG